MNQNRKDQDVPNRLSNTEQAERSRDTSRGTERNRASESTSRGSGSVMDDQETFEHGSGTSEVARGMGSSSERGMESGRASTKSGDRQSRDRQSGGISNRGLDEEREEQGRLPERGRSQSEE